MSAVATGLTIENSAEKARRKLGTKPLTRRLPPPRPSPASGGGQESGGRPASRHRDGAAVRARRAFDGRGREDIDELILPLGDELVEDEVLVVEDAVLRLQLAMHREGERLVGVRHRLD